MPKPPPQPKLKILALHGDAQNGQFFRERTGAVRKQLKSVAEFTFIDAPHAATGAFLGQIDEATRGAPLGWYNTRDGNRPAISGAYEGLVESLELVSATCRTQGPFDGVLGFSQGATLAALLCLTRPDLFTFAVLFAGYVPRDAQTLAWMDAGVPGRLPSFHCLGLSDASVPPDIARSLASRFAAPVIHEHDGGHVVPGNAPLRTALKAFMVARRDAAALEPPADFFPTPALEALRVTQDDVPPPPPPPPPPPGGWGSTPILADEEEAFEAEFEVAREAYAAMPSWKKAELLQKVLRPSAMIGRRVKLPVRVGGGFGVIRDVQANLCFVEREVTDDDEVETAPTVSLLDGLEAAREETPALDDLRAELKSRTFDRRVTCHRDELSYAEDDADE